MHMVNEGEKAVFRLVAIPNYAKQLEPSCLAYSIVITVLKPQHQKKLVMLFQGILKSLNSQVLWM